MSQSGSFSSASVVVLAPVTHPESYPYQVLPTDFYIIVDTDDASTEIDLLGIPETGRRYFIKDGTGESNANPITVNGNGNTIDSQDAYMIQAAYGYVGVLFDGFEWKVINQ